MNILIRSDEISPWNTSSSEGNEILKKISINSVKSIYYEIVFDFVRNEPYDEINKKLYFDNNEEFYDLLKIILNIKIKMNT
jgi:hypothetical protein